MRDHEKLCDLDYRVALVLLEHDDKMTQNEVAEIFDVSKTTLRRGLARFAERNELSDPGIRERVSKLREKIVRRSFDTRWRNRRKLDDPIVQRILAIRNQVPEATDKYLTDLFQVSPSTFYRHLRLSQSKENASNSSPSKSTREIYKTATHVIFPAVKAIESFAIPNDLDERNRDLFLQLRNSVEHLEGYIEELEERNTFMESELETLSQKIETAKPIWKEAFETFVIKMSESSGTNLGKGSVFAAGFVAGTLYKAFT